MGARLLVTGFEAFGGHSVNPSWDALADLESLPAGVVLAKLPVAWRQVDALLAQLIEDHRPERVLMFGVHGGSDSSGRQAQGFYLERFAINCDAAKIADNSGEERSNVAIDTAHPRELKRQGDAFEMLMAALRSAEFCATISEDAGRYLCNHSYYRVLERRDANRSPRACAFVHVPPSIEMRDDGLALEAYKRAYEILIDTFLRAPLSLDGLRKQ